VSCGAHRAAYNWATWRQGTCGIASDTYSTAVSDAEFGPGDVLVKCGVHVVSCSYRNGNNINIIEANSDDYDKVIERSATISEYTDQGYSRRRLRSY